MGSQHYILFVAKRCSYFLAVLATIIIAKVWDYMTERHWARDMWASITKKPECRTGGAPWNSFHCGVSREWIGHSYVAVALFPASGRDLGMRLTWLHQDITTSHCNIIPSFFLIVMHYTLHFHDHHCSPVERMEDHCSQSSSLPLALPDSNNNRRLLKRCNQGVCYKIWIWLTTRKW